MDEPRTLLLVDDDDAFRSVLARELGRRGYAVVPAATGREALEVAGRKEPDVVLLDLRLPDTGGLDVLRALRERRPEVEVVMLTGHGTIDTAIEAIRAGAFDYVAKPCPLGELEIRLQRALERRSLRERARLLERGLAPADPASGLVGESAAFREAVRLAERVAAADSSVLILGETGTGKDVLARLIHARSRRAEHPFVVIECAALQEDLLQSELFGHERGAFTGADRAKPGLFEVASGGTVFLDEIGEVSLATQVKLLRVLETSTFRRVGGTSERRVDVRVVAATNRDLPARVRQGLFREDLYYRLATVTLRCPPLRERGGDVDALARHFVALLGARFGIERRLGEAAADLLRRYPWPGNVRELIHVVEGALVVSDGPEILPAHLPAELRGARPRDLAAGDGMAAAEDGGLPTLEALERAHVERVLRHAQGHRGTTARILGISERNLYRKLRDYGLLT